ncbi:hypothetical protein ACRWDZ_25100, partial [Escherichia coli]
TGPQSIHILRGVRQQQDEPGRFSICSRQAAVVLALQGEGMALCILVCSGFAGRRDGPVHPGMFVSGCAALRGDVAPLLPGISFRPFYPLTRIKK